MEHNITSGTDGTRVSSFLRAQGLATTQHWAHTLYDRACFGIAHQNRQERVELSASEVAIVGNMEHFVWQTDCLSFFAKSANKAALCERVIIAKEKQAGGDESCNRSSHRGDYIDDALKRA